METMAINNLELQIEKLLAEMERLQIENIKLRQQLLNDSKRQQASSDKTHITAEKIKKIVKQLREAMS